MRSVTMILFFLMIAPLAHAGGLEALGIDSDLKGIIDHFHSRMSMLIAQAAGEARVTMVTGYQLGDLMIKNLETAYGDSLKLTLKELDKRQQQAFIDVAKMLDQMEAQVREPVNDFNQNIANANLLVADTTRVLVTNKPLITGYFPAYIAPQSLKKSITIRLAGLRLQSAEVPKLRLEGIDREFTPSALTDVNLSYVIPRNLLPVIETGTTFIRAELVFTRDDRWIRWPWSDAGQVTFDLLFTVLPENLGTYAVSRTVDKPRLETKPFITPTLYAAKSGGGGDERSDCYIPEPGYKFDVNSATLKRTLYLGKKDDDTSPGVNAGGIYYKDGFKTEGRICVVVTAFTGCTECGAETAGHLEVNMVKEVKDQSSTTTEAQPLKWNDDLSIPMLDEARNQEISFRLFDDISRIVSATERSRFPFLLIEPNIPNHATYVRPVRDF